MIPYEYRRQVLSSEGKGDIMTVNINKDESVNFDALVEAIIAGVDIVLVD